MSIWLEKKPALGLDKHGLHVQALQQLQLDLLQQEKILLQQLMDQYADGHL